MLEVEALGKYKNATLLHATEPSLTRSPGMVIGADISRAHTPCHALCQMCPNTLMKWILLWASCYRSGKPRHRGMNDWPKFTHLEHNPKPVCLTPKLSLDPSNKLLPDWMSFIPTSFSICWISIQPSEPWSGIMSFLTHTVEVTSPSGPLWHCTYNFFFFFLVIRVICHCVFLSHGTINASRLGSICLNDSLYLSCAWDITDAQCVLINHLFEERSHKETLYGYFREHGTLTYPHPF